MEKTIPEFGTKRENEERRDGGCAVVFDPAAQKFAIGRQNNGFLRLFSGGVDVGESTEEGTLREVTEEGGLCDFGHVEEVGQAFAHYHNTLKNVNRVALVTCYLVILKSTKLVPVKLEEHEKFSLDWVIADEIISNWESRNQNKDVEHWIYFFKKAIQRIKELGYDKTNSI
jgi:8-oxo-dGTP pyrophosphatase MutT (NUDIX family)